MSDDPLSQQEVHLYETLVAWRAQNTAKKGASPLAGSKRTRPVVDASDSSEDDAPPPKKARKEGSTVGGENQASESLTEQEMHYESSNERGDDCDCESTSSDEDDDDGDSTSCLSFSSDDSMLRNARKLRTKSAQHDKLKRKEEKRIAKKDAKSTEKATKKRLARERKADEEERQRQLAGLDAGGGGPATGGYDVDIGQESGRPTWGHGQTWGHDDVPPMVRRHHNNEACGGPLADTEGLAELSDKYRLRAPSTDEEWEEVAAQMAAIVKHHGLPPSTRMLRNNYFAWVVAQDFMGGAYRKCFKGRDRYSVHAVCRPEVLRDIEKQMRREMVPHPQHPDSKSIVPKADLKRMLGERGYLGYTTGLNELFREHQIGSWESHEVSWANPTPGCPRKQEHCWIINEVAPAQSQPPAAPAGSTTAVAAPLPRPARSVAAPLPRPAGRSHAVKQETDNNAVSRAHGDAGQEPPQQLQGLAEVSGEYKLKAPSTDEEWKEAAFQVAAITKHHGASLTMTQLGENYFGWIERQSYETGAYSKCFRGESRDSVHAVCYPEVLQDIEQQMRREMKPRPKGLHNLFPDSVSIVRKTDLNKMLLERGYLGYRNGGTELFQEHHGETWELIRERGGTREWFWVIRSSH